MMARLFVLTVFAYPAVLALLCVGAGLLVDRCAGRSLPAALLPSVGAATLIALSQLSTYITPLASATPYLMAALALVGLALSRARARTLLRRISTWPWLAVVPLIAYLLAIAPVLLAGRASFSSFMALSDSAVHLIGADFLIHHGQHHAHLDLRNSYGQFINDYYNTSYPSGSDTLFGGSALLLRLPLIWAFQPFNAFMLAIASGPAWLLARAIGLRGGWAAAAALSATVPALVYAYELIGSVKEITALGMILTLGALVATHRRWASAGTSPARAIPFALVLAGGVSALGIAFGAWTLAAVVVLLAAAVGERRAGRRDMRSILPVIAVAGFVALLAAWPTWIHFSASLHVAQAIAATSNPGNLHEPLKWTQVLGVWLGGSYKQPPTGAALTITNVLIAVMLVACTLGALHLLRTRRFALAGWIALTLLVWLALSRYASTWADAKSIMLSSSVVVLLAWSTLAWLLALAERAPALRALRLVALALALAFAGGALASDAALYHSSNLAPTPRYEELASLNHRFAGRGPALFTDFDEYSMYELRDLDIGGADFAYPPPALAGVARGYGYPVDLARASPAALEAYPLIITRRDPSAIPPPSAFRLLWQGRYYQVWRRLPGARAALARYSSASGAALACARVRRTARYADTRHATLLAETLPELARVPLTRARRPAGWGRQRRGLSMKRPGTLSSAFTTPHAGVWLLWLQGQFMPRVSVAVDGRTVGSIAGQLAGNSLVPDTTPPIALRLAAGAHRLSVTRSGFSLSPGSGGAAVLDAIFLTPRGAPARSTVELPAGGRSLCSRRYRSIEVSAR